MKPFNLIRQWNLAGRSRLGGLLVVLLLIHSSCGRKENGLSTAANESKPKVQDGLVVLPPDSPKLRQLRIEMVRRADMPIDEIIAPGKIEANPNRVSHIVLPVAGRVTEVMVKLGDYISKNQPLLTIQSPDADAAMSNYLQSEATLTQTKAALTKAQADCDRSSDLYAHSAIAQKELLNAEMLLTQAKSSVEQAQANREQALRRVELLGLKPGDFKQAVIVRSSISGKVLEMNVAAGEYRNDITTPLMTIADLASVWVSSDVPESYIRRIQIGERVEINLVAFPGETFEGRVARIADTVDPQTRTVKVRAELENSNGKFRPEMFGNIHHIESMQRMLVLPAGALVQGPAGSSVFVEKSPGCFQETLVVTGKRTGDLVAIQSGLSDSQRVVVDGVMLLKGL